MTLDCRPDKARQRRHPARLRALTPDGASLIRPTLLRIAYQS